MKFLIPAFFYKQHFYKQRQAEIGKKLAKARQNLEADPRYQSKIMGDIMRNNVQKKCVCFNEVIEKKAIKMRLKIKNRSQRYNIKRPWPSVVSAHLL